MARITWQNVTAPDLSTSRAALQQAGNSLTSGFEGFADSFRDIEQQQKDAYSQEALARLAQVSDPNQLNALMASDGLAGLGVTDSRYLNADAMQKILGRPKALFDNQNTAMDTANVASQLNERDELLQGKKRQQGATYDSTVAGTALSLAQADEAKKRIENTTSIIETRNARAAADKKRWEDENTERDFQSEAQLEIKAANDFSRPFIQAADQINDPALLEKWINENKEAVYANPKLVNEKLNKIFDKGPMYAEPDFTAAANFDLNQAALEAKANAERKMGLYYNDPTKLGWNKNAFKEFAQREFREGSDELEYALAFINEQPERGINPDFAAEIANDPSLTRGAQTLEQQQIQLQGKKLKNPLYNAVNIIEGKDSAYKGSYAELMSQLSNEENKLWDINNAKVTAYVQDVASKNTDIPKDLIALVVMDGGGLDPRNLFQRAIPKLGDFTLNEKQIEAQAREFMSIFEKGNSDRLQSVLALRAEEDRLNSQTDRFNRRLEAAGREATGTSGYSEEARNRIVAQTILDAEGILGRRLRPEEEADIVESATANPSTTPGSNNWNQSKYDALVEAKLKEIKEQQNQSLRSGNRANR